MRTSRQHDHLLFQRNGIRFLAEAKDFSLLQWCTSNLLTNGYRRIFSSGTAVGAWSLPRIFILGKVKNLYFFASCCVSYIKSILGDVNTTIEWLWNRHSGVILSFIFITHYRFPSADVVIRWFLNTYISSLNCQLNGSIYTLIFINKSNNIHERDTW